MWPVSNPAGFKVARRSAVGTLTAANVIPRPLPGRRTVDLISRFALAAVLESTTGANTHRLIVASANSTISSLVRKSGGERIRYLFLSCALLAGLTLLGCQRPHESPAPSQDSATPDKPPADTTITSKDATAVSSWQSQFTAVLAGADNTLLITDQAITADQLGQLVQLDGPLEQLLIDAGGVDDDSLSDVLTIKSLVHLRLRECPLGDRGFEQFGASELDRLRILNVPQAQVTSRGLASLAALPSLVQLRLGGPRLDDAAVAVIAKLPALRRLHLIGPSITDAGLAELAKAPLLSSFYLDDCPLSDSAWEQLFAANPKLHVHVDQQHHDRDPHQH